MADELDVEDQVRRALRAYVAGIHPASDVTERVYADLRRGWRRRGEPRSGAGWVAAAAAVAVLVVAVVVLAASQRGPGVPAHAGSRAPVGARGLAARLAVLRRPQTPADRLTRRHGVLLRGTVPSLTRLGAVVRLPPGHENSFPAAAVPGPHPTIVRIYLVVSTPRSAGQPARVGDLIGTIVTSSSGGAGGGGGQPAAALGDQSEDFGSGNGVQESIVPDGVSRVKWVFAGFAPYRKHAVTIYPTVRNNLAYSRILLNEGGLVSVTWYSADGRVIPSVTRSNSPTA